MIFWNATINSLCKVTYVKIDDNQFLQAVLPAALGGLGVSTARLLALPAFLASAVGAKDALSKIFGLEHVDGTYDDALKRWFELGKIEMAPENEIQKNWTESVCNIRLLRSHMRLKKNRPYNHWLKSQGQYLLCFYTSKRSEPIRFTCDMRLEPVTT